MSYVDNIFVFTIPYTTWDPLYCTPLFKCYIYSEHPLSGGEHQAMRWQTKFSPWYLLLCWRHRYLMSRLSLQVFYLWRHVLSRSPPFILWWSNLEILFSPLHRSSPLAGGLRCRAIQTEHCPYTIHIAERTQKAVHIMRYLWLKNGGWYKIMNVCIVLYNFFHNLATIIGFLQRCGFGQFLKVFALFGLVILTEIAVMHYFKILFLALFFLFSIV
jgi:hypothetical protein